MTDDCACHNHDAYDCWRSRHQDWDASREEIERDGGPCECACHDLDPDDLESDDGWDYPDYPCPHDSEGVHFVGCGCDH